LNGAFRSAAALPVGETDDVSCASEVAWVLTQGINNRFGIETTTQLLATVRSGQHQDDFLAGAASCMEILEVTVLQQLFIPR
jgi:hypothetical protein